MDEFDFVDYILYYDRLNENGNIFSKDAFKDCIGLSMPIVYYRNYNLGYCFNENLGYAFLEDRGDGIVANCKFLDTDMGKLCKDELVNTDHYGLSFYATHVDREGQNIIFGRIVSVLVLPADDIPRSVSK